nr:MAG TPA: hypothetical protein [Bacteriophage sp.]
MKIRITVIRDSVLEGRAMRFNELKKENGKWTYTWWGADEDELEDWEEEFSSSAEMWERFENFDWSEIMGFDADHEYAHKVAAGGKGDVKTLYRLIATVLGDDGRMILDADCQPVEFILARAWEREEAIKFCSKAAKENNK